MKNISILILVFLLIIPGVVQATVGIGIRWYTEAEIVSENSQKCVTYGLYNPFDRDVYGYIEGLGNLSDIYESEEPKLIPGGTSSDENIPTQICFDIPKVYREDCLAGFFLCSRECEEEQVIYNGEVQAAYTLESTGGTGSATGSSMAARLRLKVQCEPYQKDWTPLYAIVIIVVIIIGTFYYKRKRL